MTDTISSTFRISLRDILFIVFSKIHVLIGTLAIVVLLTVVSSFVISPIYEVSSSILIKPTVQDSLVLNTFVSFRSTPVSPEDINSEINIMTSEALLRRVVKDLGMDQPAQEEENLLEKIVKTVRSGIKRTLVFLRISFEADPMDAAITTLRSSLDIEPVTLSNIILISMKGDDPEEITKIVNTFVDHYIDYHIEIHKPKGGIEFYSQQSQYHFDKLNIAEEKLKAFQKKWSIVDIKTQRAANLELLKMLREVLSQVRSESASRESKLSQLEKTFQQTGEFTAMVEELRSNAVIVELTKAMVPMLVELERISLLYPEGSVEYQDAFSQLNRFKEEIKKEQQKVLSGISFDLQALVNQEKTILQEIDRIESESLFLTEKEVGFEQLNRDIEISKKNYLLYQDRTEEARISDQKDASRVANVSVACWAYAPSVPVFPKKVLMTVISIFVGLMAGLGSAFAAYYLDHTVKRPDDLDINCQVPVLSSLEKVEMPEGGV